MIQNLCRSFSAAMVLCAAGLPLAASAEQPVGNARANLQETVEVAVEQVDAETTEMVPPDREAARLEPDNEFSDRFEVTDHTFEGQRLAILRIDHLPIFTFFEESETVAAKADELTIAATEDGFIRRAETAAQQIDAFVQAAGDPNAIGVRWDADLEEYVITLDGEQLVLINEATGYANTTGQRQLDALQATNRLRNLLGATTNLTEVEGAPEPEPTVAAQANWGVASTFTGRASWYGPGFHGNQTASGEIFNQNALTAAHRTLPFGTRVRVTNVSNNRYVIVRINDRGPFSHGRVIDLSAGAAREIGLHIAGVGTVRVEVLAD